MQKAERIYIVDIELTHGLFFGLFKHTHEAAAEVKATSEAEAMLKVYQALRFTTQAGSIKGAEVDVVGATRKI